MLAALHYNENASRQQLLDKDGQPLYVVRFPKWKKGEFSVLPVKEDSTYG
jgi:hypothetical protein